MCPSFSKCHLSNEVDIGKPQSSHRVLGCVCSLSEDVPSMKYSNIISSDLSDGKFTTYSTPYSAGIVCQFGDIAYNIFCNRGVFISTPYILRNVGDKVTVTINDSFGVNTYSRILTKTSNIGVYDGLFIVFDNDPWLRSQSPEKCGQYIAIVIGAMSPKRPMANTPTINTNGNLILYPYSYLMELSATYTLKTSSKLFKFYIDKYAMPTITYNKYKINTDTNTLNLSITVKKLVTEFYNYNRLIIISCEESAINTHTFADVHIEITKALIKNLSSESPSAIDVVIKYVAKDARANNEKEYNNINNMKVSRGSEALSGQRPLRSERHSLYSRTGSEGCSPCYIDVVTTVFTPDDRSISALLPVSGDTRHSD